MGPAMCESIRSQPGKSAVLGYQSLARFARSAWITVIPGCKFHGFVQQQLTLHRITFTIRYPILFHQQWTLYPG